jgi:hypothetical protein
MYDALIYEIIIVLCLIAITYGILTIKVNKISRSVLHRYRCPWCGDVYHNNKEIEESGYIKMAQCECDSNVRKLIMIKGRELYDEVKSIYGDK